MNENQQIGEIVSGLQRGERAEAFASALALAELCMRPDSSALRGERPWSEPFGSVLAAERRFPGVADVFWDAVQFDCDDREQATSWMLEVLTQRGPIALEVPCEAIDAQAHEIFEADAAALRTLVERGFHDLVTKALTRDALSLGADRELREWLIGRFPGSNREMIFDEAVFGLFRRHGVVAAAGIELGAVAELRHPKGKGAVALDYRMGERRTVQLLICSRNPQQALSAAELWQMADVVLVPEQRGRQISRQVAAGNSRFRALPDIPASEGESHFFANGYSATVFLGDAAVTPMLRIDYPRT